MASLEIEFRNEPGSYPIEVAVKTSIGHSAWKTLLADSWYHQFDFDENASGNIGIEILIAGKYQSCDHDAVSTVVNIKSISINKVDIKPILNKIAKYEHSNNGFGLFEINEFTDMIGFDGAIHFEIQRPLAYWFYSHYPW